MFTIEQIKAAHSKMKSGADFPNYVQDILKLGVTHYDTYVIDGHTDYFDKDNNKISSVGKEERLAIADKSTLPLFQKALKEHQQGKTSYLTFCENCALGGVEKWKVSIVSMTCIYFDKAGNEMLVEAIPTP